MADYHNLLSFGFDGRIALETIIKESSYKTIEQAVASLTLFSHPDTVAGAKGRNIFRIIRASMSKNEKRGNVAKVPSVGLVMLDDNKGPTDTFIWANNITRKQYRDVQFCHIWDDPYDVERYTNLANICMIPAFLSKLTDTADNIKALLRYRAFCLYNIKYGKRQDPAKPYCYDDLDWASTLQQVDNLELALRNAMKSKPKDRTTGSARQIGWLFSNYEPDNAI
jgi:hypothetical protein